MQGISGNEVTLGIEALHLSLSSSDRKMGVLDLIVVSQSTGLVAVLAAQDL